VATSQSHEEVGRDGMPVMSVEAGALQPHAAPRANGVHVSGRRCRPPASRASRCHAAPPVDAMARAFVLVKVPVTWRARRQVASLRAVVWQCSLR